MSGIIKDLPKAKGTITENAPMAGLTRFGTGGTAEALFAPRDAEDLSHFLRHMPKDIGVHSIGFGSNMLVRDGLVNGVVIRLSAAPFSKIEYADGTFKCGAFASNSLIAKAAMENGIDGMAFLSGIPGSIGGSIPANSGCFGREIKDILADLEIVDTNTGEARTISAEECGLSYRSSKLPKDAIIISARLKGSPGEAAAIAKAMEEIRAKKDAAQPTYAKTAGSVFKNPSPDKPAWKLIRDAGMQGLKTGGAIVSPAHANFIVNEGNATAADIEDLAEKVRASVYGKFGIMLEYEIKIIGARRAGNP